MGKVGNFEDLNDESEDESSVPLHSENVIGGPAGDVHSNLMVPSSIQVAKPGEAYLRSTAHFNNRSKPSQNSFSSSKRSSVHLYDGDITRK